MKKLITFVIAAMLNITVYAQVSSSHAYAVGNTDSVYIYWDAYSINTEISGCYLYKKITEGDEYELISPEMITSLDSCFSFTDTGYFNALVPPSYSIRMITPGEEPLEINTCQAVSMLKFENISSHGVSFKTKPWNQEVCCFDGKIFFGEIFITDVNYNNGFAWAFLLDDWVNHEDNDYQLDMNGFYPYYDYTELVFTYPFIYRLTTLVGTPENPMENELLHNHPNPFSTTSHIGFVLKEASTVVLEVLDINGHRVRMLVNETLSAGSHRIVFYRENLPSGMYFCKLTTGKQFRVNKMIIR